MIPNLSALSVTDVGCLVSIGVGRTPKDAEGPATKKPRTSSMIPSTISFKAYFNNEWRELSNLFGSVEWRFQQTKFREGSAVWEWLNQGSQKNWTFEEFHTVRVSLFENRSKKMTDEEYLQFVKKRSQSWVKFDDPKATDKTPQNIAHGVLAQSTSIIVRNLDAEPSKSLEARRRLNYILGVEGSMDVEDAKEWHSQNVYKLLPQPLYDMAAILMMRKFVRDKFQNDTYRELLLRTEKSVLSEAARGNGNLWSAGTDGQEWLGKLLMNIRDELKDPSGDAESNFQSEFIKWATAKIRVDPMEIAAYVTDAVKDLEESPAKDALVEWAESAQSPPSGPPMGGFDGEAMGGPSASQTHDKTHEDYNEDDPHKDLEKGI